MFNEISIPEEKKFGDVVFPLSLGPTTEIKTIENAIEYIKKNMDSLMNKLLIHGAILFRGFPINDPKDFNDFVLAFGWQDLPYIGKNSY
jgi:hypothetical protein